MEKQKELIAELHAAASDAVRSPADVMELFQARSAALQGLFFGEATSTAADEPAAAEQITSLLLGLMPAAPADTAHIAVTLETGCLPYIAAQGPFGSQVLFDAVQASAGEDAQAKERRMELECLWGENQAEKAFQSEFREALLAALRQRYGVQVTF